MRMDNQLLKLTNCQRNGLLRKRITVSSHEGIYIKVCGKSLINFSSNDYLNLAQDRRIKAALIKAIKEYGMGSTASAFISGFHEVHENLETKIAQFFGRERGLLFNSGYLANVGIMMALGHRHGHVVLDKHCHASLLDGLRLSGTKYHRYTHQDYLEAERLLNQGSSSQLLISESIFSMDGSLTNVPALAEIAEQAQAMLILDDAHGAGVLGENGGGACEFYQLDQSKVPLLIVPLGKAFAGMGAVVLGSSDLIEYILQFVRTYRYTTALAPHLAAGLSISLELIYQEKWRREKLMENIASFITFAKTHDLPLMNDALTPIKTIWVGDNQKTLKLQKQLMEEGYFVSAIRPPTVAAGSARLRISLASQHEKKHLSQLVNWIRHYLRDEC